MRCRLRKEQEFEFKRFLNLGDHPRVRQGDNGFYILSVGGPIVVHKGDFIVKIKAGQYSVFSASAFSSQFEIIAED